ncbi:hypothetical protein PF002_g14093 [Phytophthora fragariae]|uniref:Uncharacterized protein n=1 Tax=Phytophthora fragariae TaxID=53985 RepID=A0A6A3YZ03_9STRA|nr:hypothetical protein PF003_g10202 [Phytophthora fragariae]KAE9226519.1 hypothetical protein PF002_g14093 [Phytophthora fragariae]
MRLKNYLRLPYPLIANAILWPSRPNFELPKREVQYFGRNSSSTVSAKDGVPSVGENVPHLSLRVPF